MMLKIQAFFAGATFKIICVALICCAVGYGVWRYRSMQAEEDQAKAVKAAQDADQAVIVAERAKTDLWQGLATGTLSQILNGVNNIKVTHTTINRNIQTEVASNPTFYDQAIPAGGYTQWMAARAQWVNAMAPITASDAISAPAASAPIATSQPTVGVSK